MKGIVDTIVWLIGASRQIYARKWSFLALFAIAFFGSLAVLAEIDLLPEAPPAPTVTLGSNGEAAVSTAASMVAEAPTKVEIPKIKLSARVENPTSTTIAALDQVLLKGAVHYPTSAKLGETGNVVLFGHSSYLPVVNNSAYKTFNDIQKLAAGDRIMVYSSDAAYTYEVRTVEKKRADDGTVIPLSVTGKVLTLVTCNSFGAKEDRFFVVADLVLPLVFLAQVAPRRDDPLASLMVPRQRRDVGVARVAVGERRAHTDSLIRVLVGVLHFERGNVVHAEQVSARLQHRLVLREVGRVVALSRPLRARLARLHRAQRPVEHRHDLFGRLTVAPDFHDRFNRGDVESLDGFHVAFTLLLQIITTTALWSSLDYKS